MIRFVVLSLAALLVFPTGAGAQDPDADPALPEITPREIEIRGEYRVVFPSLERPTLQELQPRTRVQALPLEGLPAASAIGFQVDALPPLDLSAPAISETAQSPLTPLLSGMNGSIELQGGRFTERRAATDVQLPLGSRTLLHLQGDYEGMKGAQPFAARDARTAFDTGTGMLRLSHRGGSWTLQSDVDGAYRQYDLYGAVDAGTAAPVPERTAARIGTEHTLRLDDGEPLTWTLGYDGHRLDTDTAGFSTNRFHTSAASTIGLAALDLRLRGTATLAGHSSDDGFSGSSRSGAVHGLLRFVDRADLRVAGGVSIMSAYADAAPPASARTATYGAPYALVEWRPATPWLLYAEQRPTITLHTPIDLAQANPYLTAAPARGATAHTLNATAGAQWSGRALQLDVHGGLTHSPTRQFFAQTSESLFAVQYLEATTWSLGMDAALQALAPWFGTIDVAYTGGSVSGGDGLPLTPRATGEATVGYQFAERRARLQMHLHAQSARDLTAAGTATVPGFVSFGLSGDVQITPNIEATAYVQDVGSNDLTAWPGYPQPTARVGGGLRLLW